MWAHRPIQSSLDTPWEWNALNRLLIQPKRKWSIDIVRSGNGDYSCKWNAGEKIKIPYMHECWFECSVAVLNWKDLKRRFKKCWCWCWFETFSKSVIVQNRLQDGAKILTLVTREQGTIFSYYGPGSLSPSGLFINSVNNARQSR